MNPAGTSTTGSANAACAPEVRPAAARTPPQSAVSGSSQSWALPTRGCHCPGRALPDRWRLGPRYTPDRARPHACGRPVRKQRHRNDDLHRSDSGSAPAPTGMPRAALTSAPGTAPGTRLVPNDATGGFTILAEAKGTTLSLGEVDSPWAVDAEGNKLPTPYGLQGTPSFSE